MGCDNNGASYILYSLFIMTIYWRNKCIADYLRRFMSQEYESHLFIGGVVDGQWFSVPKTARRWTLPVIATSDSHLGYFKNVKDVPEAVPYTEHTYYRTKLAECMTNKVFVFVSEDLYSEKTSYHDNSMWKIVCKLVNNYKVIK